MTTLTQVLQDRFGGLLHEGSHSAGDSAACALEAASIVRGIAFTGDPSKVGLPDLRALNDGPWSTDEGRTVALVPVLEALWEWDRWPDDRRTAWAIRVAERTIREIVPIALRSVGLDAAADRCEREGTRDAAWEAAGAARAAASAAGGAAWAVWAAAGATRAAAGARRAAWAAAEAAGAAGDAGDDVLVLACNIWREEAVRPWMPVDRPTTASSAGGRPRDRPKQPRDADNLGEPVMRGGPDRQRPVALRTVGVGSLAGRSSDGLGHPSPRYRKV